MGYDELTAERVRRLLGSRPDISETKLMGGLCFIVRGNMCCSVSARGGLLVRVGAAAQEQALAEPHVAPMVMAGRRANGFVRVAPDGYRTDAALKRWIERGLDFAATLPAKRSRKPRRRKPGAPTSRRIGAKSR